MAAASNPDVSGTLADVNNQLERSAEEVQEAELHVQSLLRRQAALVHALRLLQHKHLVSALQHTQLGFTQDGRPVASMVVHRCLLNWRALDVTDSATQTLLQSIISVVTHALDENQLNKAANGGQLSPATSLDRTGGSPDVTEGSAVDEGSAQRVLALCAYWLTVTSVLLALLHRQVEEHASYLGSGKGSGSQRLGEDMGSSSRAPAAPTKLEEFQNKIANKFSMFRDNILKRSGPSESKGVQDPGATAASGGTPRASFDVSGHGLVEPTPAQVFRHSLDLLLLQAYAGVRDSIKKQLAPLLPSCIQAPERVALPEVVSSSPARTKEQTEFEAEAEAARLAPADPGVRFTLDDSEEQQERGPGGDGQPQDEAAALAAAAAQEQLAEALKGPPAPGPLHAWEELVAALQLALDELRAQCVPRILIKCVFKQLLGFVDSQLFNQLLLRPDCCCASNARHVLAGLKLLDQWVVAGAADAMMRPLYQELRHVRQAATFLVTPGKSKLSVEDITGSLCPALTAQQIYRLCTTCWDDAADIAVPSTPLAPTPTPTAAGSEAAPTITPAATPRAPPAAPPATVDGEASATANGAAQENQPEEDMVHVTRSDLTPLSHSGPLDSEPRERLADLVSGEVLEALKGAGGGLQGNGGLLITFLLDEWQAPIIAPEGCTAREVLGLIESKDLYGPLELPPEFDTPSCPRSVFAFLEEPLTVPPHLNK